MSNKQEEIQTTINTEHEKENHDLGKKNQTLHDYNDTVNNHQAIKKKLYSNPKFKDLIEIIDPDIGKRNQKNKKVVSFKREQLYGNDFNRKISKTLIELNLNNRKTKSKPIIPYELSKFKSSRLNTKPDCDKNKQPESRYNSCRGLNDYHFRLIKDYNTRTFKDNPSKQRTVLPSFYNHKRLEIVNLLNMTNDIKTLPRKDYYKFWDESPLKTQGNSFKCYQSFRSNLKKINKKNEYTNELSKFTDRLFNTAR